MFKLSFEVNGLLEVTIPFARFEFNIEVNRHGYVLHTKL